ncbi:MAG: hypothetical protein M1830_010819 [Pleopsidium flavum]|nr:MAG: hypothetical protein M1830_010819 [Pleopsidium flavum]
MLLAAALMRLLHLWDAGQLEALPQQLVQDRMPVVLMQILNRTLLTQSSQGSWGPKDSSEVTAYAVLTLTTLSSLPCARLLKTEIDSATKVGRQILSQSKNNWAKPQYIWVEKVTYGSAVLSQAYCLAAMNAPTSSNLCGDRMERIMSVPTKALIESARFFSRLNRFSKEPEWKLKASILEGHLFFLQLQSAPLEIFPPQERAKAENLKYIPYAWMIINNCEAIFLDALLLWDMMVLSMLDCLVDEYMESVVALLSEDDLKSLREIIRVLCEEPGARKLQTRKLPHPEDDFTGLSNKDWIHPTKVHVGGQFEHLPTVKAVLARYVKAIHDHIRVQHASSFDQLSLHAELRTFLLSHIVQIQDNARFSRQQFHCADVTTPFLTPRTSYYTWTHTTAAEHTSCHFSFAFYACLLGSSFGERADCFSSVYQKYLARDLCSHLGVMIRLYSDYASILRDHANFNLNSINFPEFHYHPREHRAQGENSEAKEMRLETTLMDLAQYERDCVSMVAERLMKDLGTGLEREKRTANAVTLYVCVTELYADMFVANDMS